MMKRIGTYRANEQILAYLFPTHTKGHDAQNTLGRVHIASPERQKKKQAPIVLLGPVHFHMYIVP
ncbi:hypothetical protein SAMN04488513_102366 [Pseudozobellia thermophila]|uniref:Uncharacterized protein n=1 Tax=Pseudozobellia thermophila TaxID=192903 RepID=A0A1M6FBL5_9FLAO|nr:hypothetical protein SAMN04488513_102366 [Pseudozobellia thermophila]